MNRLVIIVMLYILAINLNAQSITNTLSNNGSFIIRDNSNTFLTLERATGFLELNRGLTLPYTTSSTIGVIYKSGNRFIHDFGTGNTFVGINSGNFEMTGIDNSSLGIGTLPLNTTGSENTAIGKNALNENSTGSYNTAIGSVSLSKNTTGYANTGCGIGSLYSNTEGYNNSAFGNVALYSNTTGLENSAFGTYALYSNIAGIKNSAYGYHSLYSSVTADYNSAFGYASLKYNISGVDNSAFGSNALVYNTTGWHNSAFGDQALYNCTTGNNNTAIGSGAGHNITTGSNNICIGYYALVPYVGSDNQIRIGNGDITYAGVQVAWSITSDRRWKDNILPSDLGLDFITKLNPVSYTRKNDEKKKTEYGIIAQEMEEVLKAQGIVNAAMLTIDGEGRYELRYNDLIAPMIKAIQQLKFEKDMEIEKLKATNEMLNKELDSVKEIQIRLTKLEQMMENSDIKFSRNEGE